jgi:hypothetical protein
MKVKRERTKRGARVTKRVTDSKARQLMGSTNMRANPIEKTRENTLYSQATLQTRHVEAICGNA